MRLQRADGTGPWVEITRVGRWTYDLSGVHDGVSVWERDIGDRVLGYRRAVRRAAKRLAQYQRMQERRQDVTVVTNR